MGLVMQGWVGWSFERAERCRRRRDEGEGELGRCQGQLRQRDAQGKVNYDV